jgi:hypothetical protein
VYRGGAGSSSVGRATDPPTVTRCNVRTPPRSIAAEYKTDADWGDYPTDHLRHIVVLGDVGVELRGAHGAVPQHLLHAADVCPDVFSVLARRQWVEPDVAALE